MNKSSYNIKSFNSISTTATYLQIDWGEVQIVTFFVS